MLGMEMDSAEVERLLSALGLGFPPTEQGSGA
jgi:hypothetical protein